MQTTKKHKVVLLEHTIDNLITGDLILRHIWKNTSNECKSLWQYNETVVIQDVKQYTTLNGSFRDAHSAFKKQHLYIVEEIKYKNKIKHIHFNFRDIKIIASSNNFDNYPMIPDNFIKHYINEFNKNNEINIIDVVYEYIPFSSSIPDRERVERVLLNNNTIEIIIPKDLKTYTTEEVVELFEQFGSEATSKQISFGHIPSHFVADKLVIDKFLKKHLK